MLTDIQPGLPEDDYAVYEGRRRILNRIDQEWGCNHLVMDSYVSGPDYCGLPEHDPFSDRCWYHTSGNLPSGHM